MVSSMASAVRGLIRAAAPRGIGIATGSGRMSDTGNTRRWDSIPPPITATALPTRSAWRSPAAVTIPAPSFPTASDLPTREASAARFSGGISKTAVFPMPSPETTAVDRSAGPSSMPISAGWRGAATTLTTTSSGPGAFNGMDTSDRRSRSSSPSSERIPVVDRFWSGTAATFERV